MRKTNHRKLGKKCPECGGSMDDRSTYCKSCYDINKRSPGTKDRRLGKGCLDCGKGITDVSVRCKSCAKYYKPNTPRVHSSGDLRVGSRHRGHDFTIDYAKWTKDVFERDDWKCQHCDSNEKLRAHHIYSHAKYPKLRLNVENGITLCEFHHKPLHQLFRHDVKSKQLKWFFANVK